MMLDQLSSTIADSLPWLFHGLGNTLILCVMASLVGLTAGHLGLLLRTSRWRMLRAIGWLYISLMRGTPALVQLFVVFFTLPLLGLAGQPILAAVIAIGLNSGAYVAEILRANWSVVGSGQLDAAKALGLSPLRFLRKIAGPQVWQASTPALINEFTLLLKTTPLASVVGVAELAYTGQMISAQTFRPTEVLTVVALFYLCITLPTLVLARRLTQNEHAGMSLAGRIA